MMKNILTLDEKAVAVLFPAGSEAEIDLQKSAVRKAAQAFVKGAIGPEAQSFLTDLSKKVGNDIKDATSKQIKEMFGEESMSSWSPSVTIPQSVRDSVCKHVKSTVEIEINKMVEAVATDRANRMINDMIADRRIEKYIDKLVFNKIKIIAEKQSELAAAQIVGVLTSSEKPTLPTSDVER